MSRRNALLLAAAVTDSTFERCLLDGDSVWVGRCIHCNSKLVVDDDGCPRGEATLEHVWPTAQGGTDDLDNLAVACGRCNHEKGKRHDHRRGQRLDQVAARLGERRRARWRDPEAVGMGMRIRGRSEMPDGRSVAASRRPR
jgi:5-methylcytosine-specific restriction endonuclease McrA